MDIGIIGYGTIGRFLEKELSLLKPVDKIYIYDVINNIPENKGIRVDSVDEMLMKKPNLIIECASQDAVREYAVKVLSEGISFMILSVGALLERNLLEKVKFTAERNNIKIYIPVGAIGGVDSILSAGTKKIRKVELTTTKHPKSLNRNDAKRTVIFDGVASEAVQKYPKNINVSAIITLASNMPGNLVRVRIISDPDIKINSHEIYLEGDFGKFHSKIENMTMPGNPGTSYTAALSALSLVKKILSPFNIG